MIIYKTVNLLNGKIYIGKDSKNDPNYYGSGLILKQSIEKHGIENFRKEILEECANQENLCEREIFWIGYFNSQDRNVGYNIADGGLGGDTRTHHPNREELNKAHSEWMIGNNPMKGTKRTEEQISKWRNSYFLIDRKGENNPNYGSKRTDETKESISKRRKEYWASLSDEQKMELCKKISLANSGRELSHEHKQKISDALKGREFSEDWKNKISESLKGHSYNKGIPKSEEHKRKLSEANKGNKPPNRRKVMIASVIYESLTEAHKALGIPVSTIRNRIKSKNKKYEEYSYYG